MRVFLLMLATLLLLGSFGCYAKENEALSAQVNTLTQERYDLQVKLDATQRTLDETEQKLAAANEETDSLRVELAALQSAPTPPPTVVTETKEVEKPVPAEYAFGVDCTVNGSAAVMLDGATSVTCVPNKIDGYAFDHWEVDGKVQDTTAEKLELTLSKTTQIRAVFHERRTVKCVNCYIQFLTNKGNANGKKYTEFDFEDDYTNPVTKKKEEGGKISFYITADIPKKSEVDYWLINGVKYEFSKDITKFRVEDLDEATVYEVVLKGQTKKSETKTYYTVTCTNCTFSGGGNTKAKNGKVPAGTKITVVASGSSSSEGDFIVNGAIRHMTSNGGSSGNYKFTFTYTVNSDTTIEFYPTIN